MLCNNDNHNLLKRYIYKEHSITLFVYDKICKVPVNGTVKWYTLTKTFAYFIHG